MRPTYDLTAWRNQIPLLQSHVPMNNCSQAPQTHATRRAAEDYLDSWGKTGMDWDAWIGEVEEARATFAALIGASADEIAVSTSVSQATASVASALDFARDLES
jgi:selenocysteine lyase/cysteine desulfurase